MAKHTFEVTENMRRVTRYEVDDADLTPELADLMERLNEDGDLTEEEDYLVNRLVAAAGDQDHGEVMDIFLADDAEYALSIVTEAEAASLGDIEDESTRRFFTERGVNLEED